MLTERRQHDPEIKDKALEMLRETSNCEEVARQLELPPSTVHHWARVGGITTNGGGRLGLHSDETRTRAIEMFAGGARVGVIADELKVPPGTIYNWVKASRSGRAQKSRTRPAPAPKPPRGSGQGRAFDPEVRAQAITMRAEGRKVLDIAKRLGVSRTVVSSWTTAPAARAPAAHAPPPPEPPAPAPAAPTLSRAEAMLAQRLGGRGGGGGGGSDELTALRHEVRALRAERDALRAALDMLGRGGDYD